MEFELKTVRLFRIKSTDEGTFGRLLTGSGFTCVTGELPWRNNAPRISCIPVGKYQCLWKVSPKFGECYHVENVPGRSSILIHAANFMGDASLGFKTELLGCIAPGMEFGKLNEQQAVLSSRKALGALEADLARKPFELWVENWAGE